MTGDELKQRKKAVIHVVSDWQIQLWLRAILSL
jgi:hypothetical protein